MAGSLYAILMLILFGVGVLAVYNASALLNAILLRLKPIGFDVVQPPTPPAKGADVDARFADVKRIGPQPELSRAVTFLPQNVAG